MVRTTTPRIGPIPELSNSASPPAKPEVYPYALIKGLTQPAGSEIGGPLIMNTPIYAREEKPKPELTRRTFIKAGTAAALSAASWNRVLGANERVGIGVIGFGLVGRIHTRNFNAQPDARVVAVSETFRPRMDAAAALVGGDVAQYRDFRRLLEDKNADAVVV